MSKDTFDEMIKAGEEFKEALELSDGDVYELLKRDNNEERYCTVAESLEQSLKEMQLIREGKLPKKTWKECMKEWDKWAKEVEEELKND